MNDSAVRTARRHLRFVLSILFWSSLKLGKLVSTFGLGTKVLLLDGRRRNIN